MKEISYWFIANISNISGIDIFMFIEMNCHYEKCI